MKHTDLDNVYPDILDTHVDLETDKVRGYVVNVSDSSSVLGGQSRGDSHGIATMGGDDFLICLEASGIEIVSQDLTLEPVVLTMANKKQRNKVKTFLNVSTAASHHS